MAGLEGVSARAMYRRLVYRHPGPNPSEPGDRYTDQFTETPVRTRQSFGDG